MDRKDKFPAKIREKLEKKGYFTLSKEQRLKSNEECLKTLEGIPFPNYDDTIYSIRRLRGAE